MSVQNGPPDPAVLFYNVLFINGLLDLEEHVHGVQPKKREESSHTPLFVDIMEWMGVLSI